MLDTPSDLGLRPPAPGTAPGCHTPACALREQRLVQRLHAREGWAVVPPRYDPGDWQEGDGVFNAAALAAYTVTLADRLGRYGLAAIGGTFQALEAVGEPPRISATPAAPAGSARRAARRSPSAPDAASAT